ncbi:uncharacterized protein LOC143033974 isoform X2 [Oratosquilla oratoria]|uniref:uncharacterized protein LOC143033974 isoform X2 n=1 Tax=Oratosquilla oratoria TaxID=337810 RepID=UPI003F7647E6
MKIHYDWVLHPIRKQNMASVESIRDGLCTFHKLERDQCVSELATMVSTMNSSMRIELTQMLLHTLADSSSPWESKHGCLNGVRTLLAHSDPETDASFINDSRETALRHLTDVEVRVREAAGEVLGALCKVDGGETYAICRTTILELIKNNLEREVTDDDASRLEHESTQKLLGRLTANTREKRNSGDASQIFHDTAGWRNLETSMKALEHMITGSTAKFLPYIDQELLDLIFVSLSHTNRFVRETGFNVCAALVSCGNAESNELLEKNPLFVYGDQLAQHLGQGLADNWSQVRLASSKATRKFLLSLPEQGRERFFPILLPRLCLNRYYVAEGVRIYSQDTWRQVTGTEGKVLVEKYIDSVVSYYIEATTANNHAVREAACSCIAELALKVTSDSVRPFVPVLLDALTVCFNDDSWPVRDAACVACGSFIVCYSQEARSTMEQLYPLFFANLKDNIPSVRQGAATAIGNIVKAYQEELLDKILQDIKEGLQGVSNQPAESERYTDLAKGGATYGVVKRKRDNDMELHSNNQMYSCGSLAPKMGRGGGGCSDCQFRRPPQPWEYADGCVYLAAELADSPLAAGHIANLLTLIAEAVHHKHYTAHVTLHETLCKCLPVIAKGLGKKVFKSHLHNFLDPVFYSLECENALTSLAASQCLTSLGQFLGPRILRGRVEEHNPSYLKALDANNFIAPL